MKVADFGCGSGFFTRAAARLVGEGGVVWAVDMQRDLLPRIKNLASAEGLSNVEVVHGDIEVLEGSNLPSNTFDLVVVTNVLFSIENKHELVAEVKRVLKVGGKALVVDWTSSHGGLGPHSDHVVPEAEARKLFENSGFAYVGAVPAGTYHWGFTVRKLATTH
jgi:ubiquinone/menaquinone biosynthesis C-methylase UbiE